MRLLDISHWQTKIDWTKIKDPVILKCTESTDYLDPTFKERQKILREKGLYFGSYHFFRDVNVDKQAEWYLKNADWKEGEITVLDFEIDCTDAENKCKEFLSKLPNPYFYTNEARMNKLNIPHPLWTARYGTNDGQPQTEPTKDWTIWQYTSKGKVEGIEGNVDLNILKTNMYSQKDPKWKDIKLGSCKDTIGQSGCFITSFCNLLNDGTTPKKLNTYLKDKSLYESGCMFNASHTAQYFRMTYEKTTKKPDIDCIFETDHYKSKGVPQHFCLIRPDGKIIDPLDLYPDWKDNPYKIISYRVFKKEIIIDPMDELKKEIEKLKEEKEGLLNLISQLTSDLEQCKDVMYECLNKQTKCDHSITELISMIIQKIWRRK